jgi:uncharacterized protein (DUF1501 family)
MTMTCTCSRRALLQGGLAGLFTAGPLARALAGVPARAAETEFFILIHAAGGWDVTLWADPRNTRAGLIEPASTANTDTAPIRLWTDETLDGDVRTFKLVQPRGSKIVFGPGIGALAELADRITLINGLAMNTVSHPDGIAFSVTGRHLQGSRSAQASVNTLLANEFGLGQTFPSISIQFPSSYAGDNLDRRAAPLLVDRVGSIASVLSRAPQPFAADDAGAVTAVLSTEASTLAARSAYGDVLKGMDLQYRGLPRMLDHGTQDIFSDVKLRAARPEFNYKARFHGGTAVNAAFAVEACKRNLVRCVSFALGGFDTHAGNYKQQAQVQQEMFDVVATLVRTLDASPHPTLAGRKLSEHTHILVMSEFCRTPQVNLAGGRDHYPNNSALVISPRFRGNTVHGKSDPEQVLPVATRQFSDGERAIAPPDLLATFVAAFGVDPHRYFRDGEVVRELLAA